MRTSILISFIFWVLLAAPLGCDGDGSSADCEEGDTQTCFCPNGIASTQTCVGENWGACECEDPGPDADSDVDSDSDSDTDSDANEGIVGVEVSALPSSGIAPLEVAFSSSVAGGNDPLSYAWTFGDGETGTGQNPTHTFASGGEYEVVLTATDADGDEGLGSVKVLVNDDLEPEVEITAVPGVGEAPLTVSFEAITVGGNPPFTYEWDFNGDGDVDATIATPVNLFETEGLHEVTVTVTDADGDEGEDTENVYVNLPNQAPEVTAQIVDGACIGNTGNGIVQLDGTGSTDSDGEITYEWRFVTVPYAEDDRDDDDDDMIDNLDFVPSAFVSDPSFTPPVNLSGISQGVLYVNSICPVSTAK